MKRALTAIGLALLAMISFAPMAASATEPIALQGDYIVDATSEQVIGNRVGDLETQVQMFAADHGIQLFVVYVDSFSNPADPLEWGADTADLNFLGDDAVLLSIAVKDRLYDFNAPTALIPDAAYDKISSDFVRPALKNSDWPGVVGATLDGIEQTVVNPPSGGSGTAAVVVGGLVVAGGATAAGIAISRRKKRSAAETAPDLIPLKELEAQASSLLVSVDDSIVSSVQELGFAEAQFGKTATETFAAAITDARAQLDAAFLLRQRLDDDVPDTDDERRAWLTEIIDRCAYAETSLEEHADAFTQMREMEKRAPEVLDQLKASLGELEPLQIPAEHTAATLTASYAPQVVSQLSSNLTEAAARQEFVRECVEAASRELANGDTSAAVVSLRAGEAALAQARTLLESPQVLAEQLSASAAEFETAAADLRNDLQNAANLASAVPPEAALALQLAVQQVEAVLQQGMQGDPVAAVAAAAAANVNIDAAIGSARDQAERVRRAIAARDEAIVRARSEVLSAEQFVETRRGAVGSTARTRLAEARRQLQVAEQLAQSDLSASYQAAQKASQYARAAQQIATSDVSGWNSGGGSSDSFGGAVLGGILGQLLSGGSGGGRSSGGWSGSNGGFTGGWGGGSSSGSRSRSSGGGSFGGSRGGSSGGRRGGGGRF